MVHNEWVVNPAQLTPYVPGIIDDPDRLTWDVVGSVVFADVSGFTKLSEKLAEQGKAGAEELTDILLGTFTDLLGEAGDEGGDLLSFGGDALLLAFVGPEHAVRATRAATRMRAALKARGPIRTGKGRVVLRISQGVHSGRFHLVLAGERQRELLVVGPDATLVTDIEGAASAGQVVVSPDTAGLLPPSCVGHEVGPGLLVRREPPPAATGSPIVAPPDLDRSRLVPPAVRRRVEAADLEAEHRRVAVGFVHVKGVDAHLAGHGPDATADALHRVVTIVSGAADEAGVCLLASDIAPDGAKLILTAGAPEAVEDAEGRLLVALRRALDTELPLAVRAGAHVGHVFASKVGAPWRHVYTVIGDAVNLSARLMGTAEPGQIVASRALLERTATPFETIELEPFMVKGKRHPQHAAVVGARVEGRGRAEGLRAPFLGRRREMSVLTAALSSARDGRGACVELVGPPGIGKTRLVDELVDLTGGLRRIRITCEPFQVDVPYYVARLVFRRLLGISFHADRAAAGAALRDRVEELAPHLLPWLPLLAVALEADADHTPEVDGLDPAHRADALAEAATGLLAALADGPQLFVFEDAMWMDEASAKLLARPLQEVDRHPWLVCTTRRDDTAGLHAGLGYTATRLELEPLDTDVAERLVSEVTEDFGLSAQDVERLCARANGNPLYLVELLRAVLDAGSMHDLPDSLEDIIAARIDDLPRLERRMLRIAAVLGDRFDPSLLADVDTDHELLDVQHLVDRLGEFLARDVDDVVFTHDLVRQVAYEGLPFARRRGVHRRAAQTLASLPGRPDDDRLTMLAHHWDHAGERYEAWTALRRAADRAARKFAFHEASSLYERALDNGRRADVDPAELAEVAEQLGDTAELAARFDTALAGYRQARALRPRSDDRQVELLRKEGMVREKAGRYDAALTWLRRGLAAVRGRTEPEMIALRAELEVSYAGVRFRQGKLRNCVAWCERAIADAEAVGARKTLAHALYVMEGALTDLDDERAADYVGRSVEIYRSLGDNLGLGRALLNMGVSADRLGRLDEAADLYQQSRDALLAAGYVLGLAHVSLNLGEIRSDQGRLDEAEAHLKDARRAASAANYSMITWAATASLGRVATRARRSQRAFELLAQAATGFDDMGAAVWAAETRVLEAEAHLFAGDPEGALAALERVGEYGDEAAAGAGIGPLALRIRGAALAGLGRTDDAREALQQSVDESASSGADYDLALSLVELARLHGGTTDEADRARQILDRLGVDPTVVCPDPAGLPASVTGGRARLVLA